MQAFEILSVEGSDDMVAVEGREFSLAADKGVAIAVPFALLFKSEDNVRTKKNAVSIPELAAMIKAEGLINPLCVVAEKVDDKLTGRFGVIAGGRRLAALAYLIEHGEMSPDAVIDCKEYSPDRAVRVSSIENAGQETMHASDQIMQFKKLVDAGLTAAEIAAHHGVSIPTVERRLKLANLAPAIMELFQEDKVGLDQLKALALASDHARQVEVWENLARTGRTSAYHIRAALVEGEVRADDRTAIFIGLEAYEAAGGTVRRDLFGTERDVYLQDRPLLEKMVQERLDARADELRADGWKWVEVMESFGYSEKSRFATVYPTRTKPEGAEAKAIETLDAMIQALRKRFDELESAAAADDEQALDEQEELEAQIELIGDLRATCASHFVQWPVKLLQRAGVVVTLTDAGTVAVHPGLVRPEDMPKAKGSAKVKGGAAADGAAKSEYSKSLMRDMTAHRTGAVAAALTSNPKVALVALLHKMIQSADRPHISSPVSISVTRTIGRVQSHASDFDAAPAAVVLNTVESSWDARLPKEPAELFRYLLTLEVSELNALLALHIAQSYDVITEDHEMRSQRFAVGDAIEQALNLNMKEWWTPTAGQYLSQVSKAQIAEAVTEACGVNEALPLEKMKKSEAVAAAAAKLDGKGWLPPVLRARAIKLVEVDVEAEDEEQE